MKLTQTTLMQSIFSYLFIGIAIYLSIVLIAYVFQDKLIYFPKKTIWKTPGDVGLVYEEVIFKNADNIPVTGWFIPAKNSKFTILYCHGNAGNISSYVHHIQTLSALDLNILIFDYQGYGGTPGKPSETGTYKDAEAAWHYLTETRGIAADSIIFYSHSLGGAIASYLAVQKKPRGLIVEGSFTHIKTIASEAYPFLPVKWLCKSNYNVENNLKKISCPVLIIHSTDDEVIPFKHGEKLISIAKEPKIFLKVKGSHDETFIESSEIYKQGLINFISSI